jgi:hypothetical protein
MLQLGANEEEIWRQLQTDMDDGRLEFEEKACQPKRKHFPKRQTRPIEQPYFARQSRPSNISLNNVKLSSSKSRLAHHTACSFTLFC